MLCGLGSANKNTSNQQENLDTIFHGKTSILVFKMLINNAYDCTCIYAPSIEFSENCFGRRIKSLLSIFSFNF